MSAMSLVGILGLILSHFTSYINLPPQVFNFICCAVITVYMIENWSLLMDLNAKQAVPPKDDKGYIDITRELSAMNNILLRKVTFLESLIIDKNKQIDFVRSKWNSQCRIPLPEF